MSAGERRGWIVLKVKFCFEADVQAHQQRTSVEIPAWARDIRTGSLSGVSP